MKFHSIEKTVLFGVLACFLSTMVGVSFAYFVSGIAIGGSGANATGTTANLLNVKYDAGSSTLNLVNAYPGKSASKSFSITITPGDVNSAKFVVSLNISANTFVKCSSSNYNSATNACTTNAQELVYTLKDSSGNTVQSGDLLSKTGVVEIATITKTVNAATTYNYTLEIKFVDTGADQNHNVNKSLTANLDVEFAE